MDAIQRGANPALPNKSKVSIHITAFFLFWQMKIQLLFGSHKKEGGGEGNEWVHRDGYPDLCTSKHHTSAP